MTDEMAPIAGRDFGRFFLAEELVPRYNRAVKELSDLRREYALYQSRRPNRWPGEEYQDDFLSHPDVARCFFWMGAPYMPKETQGKLAEELRKGNDVGPKPRQIKWEKSLEVTQAPAQNDKPGGDFPTAAPAGSATTLRVG
jgi:hypothetical protein